MAYEPTLDEVLNSLYGPEGGLTEEELAQYLPEPYVAPGYTPRERPAVAPQGGGYAPAPTTKGRTRSAVNRNLSPEARALLDTIAGDESPDYRTVYGGRKVNDLSWHPGLSARIERGPNAGQRSSAAGRYQFLRRTWEDQARKLGLRDFSPESQDLAAWNLAVETYGPSLEADLRSGDPAAIARIGRKLSGIWTSLPGGIEQGAHANTFTQRFQQHLGTQSGAPQEAYEQSQPQQSPYDIISLSDGSSVQVERGMELASVAEILKNSGVQAEPLRSVSLPDGSYVNAPYDYSDDQVFDIVKKNKPEVFGQAAPALQDDKHGYLASAKSSFESGVGSALRGLGGASEWLGGKLESPLAREAGTYLTGKGKEWQKMGQEAYQELTPEEAAAMGTEGKFRKYVGEPLAGFGGSALSAIPAMVLPGGAATRIGAFTAQELGGQLERQEAEGRPADVAQAAPYAVASGIVQNSLLGPLKYVSKAFGNPEVTSKIADIAKTQGAEAAKQYAGGLITNVLKEVGINTAEVVGSEVLSNVAERAASGLPLDTPDALAEYQNTAIKSAPGGLFGIPGGMGRHAAQQGVIEETQLAKQQAAQEAQRAKEAEAAQSAAAEEAQKQAEADAELERQAGIGADIPPITPETPPITPETPPVTPETPPVTPETPPVTPETPPVTDNIPEPTIRAKEALPPVEPTAPAHFSDVLGIASKSGKKTDIPLKKTLEQLDIENPEHQPIIVQALETAIPVAEKGQIQLDVSKAREIINRFKPAKTTNEKQNREAPLKPLGYIPEGADPVIQPVPNGYQVVDNKTDQLIGEYPTYKEAIDALSTPVNIGISNAQQIPSAGPPVRRSSPQPQVRQEGRDQAVSSQGVEPSRQGIKAPEVQEVKAPEVTGLQITDLADNRFKVSGIDVDTAQATLGKLKLPTGTRTPDGLIFNNKVREKVIGALEVPKAPEVKLETQKTPTIEAAQSIAAEKAPEVTPVAKEVEATVPVEKLPTPAEAWDSLRTPEQPAFDLLSRDTQKLWRDEYKASEGIVDKSAVNDLVKAEQGLLAKGEAGVASPHTRESINQELKKLYGENAPQIEVSDSATEKVDAATKGFFEPSTGRAVLVADNIGKGEDLHGLLRHEVAVHAKKLGKSDKEFQGILKQVDNLREQGAKDVSEAFNRVPEDTKEADRTHEALAYLVQHKSNLPIVKRFMSWLRRAAHKITGNAKWLKGDDFAVMADAVLKKAAKEAKVEVKAGKPEERQYAKAPLAKETEAESHLQKGMKAATDAIKGGLWTRFETAFINKDAAMREVIKDLPLQTEKGTLRADMVGSAQSQIFNVISAGITDGVPVYSKAGLVMIQKDAKRNINNITQAIDKLKVKNPRVYVGEIARALRGEELLKEDAELLQKMETLEEKAKKLKAYAKTQSFAEGKKADTLANRYLAEAKKLKDRLGEEGREKLVTPEDIVEAKRRLAEHPEIQPILDNVHGLLNSLVDLWEESGLVSKDVAKEWRSKPSYIPLYMAQDDILNDPSKVVRMMGGGAKSLPNVKVLKGGEHAINLLENLQKHYAFMISAAAQNTYRKAAARDLELFGAAKKTGPDTKNAIMFKEDGKQVYYEIFDPMLFDAMQAAAPITNPLLKAAREYTKAFRAVTLVNPLYWYRQLIRDPIHANVVSQTGMVTPIGATISFAKIIAGASPEYAELRRRGVVGAVDSLTDPARFKKVYDKGPHLFKKGADWVMHVHEAADAATRVEVYKAAIKEAKKRGMDREQAKDYATMRAREIINFAHQGRSETLQAIRATVPFFSAALNSLDSVARAATGKGLNRREAAEARRLFTSRMLAIASFTTAYTLAMQDDDDYLKSPDAINNWLVPTGNKDEPFIMFSLPFELGFIAKSIPELIVRLNSGTLRPYEAKKMAKEAAAATLAPPMPFPQVIKPLFELAFNVDLHTGRPVVSPSEAAKMPEEQTKGASALSIELGRALGISPIKVEHFGKGYTTELWAVMSMFAEKFLPAGQYQEERYRGEVPIMAGGAKGIVSRPDRDRDLNMFYELSQGTQQIKNSMSAAQNRGNVDAMERIMADPENKKRFYASDVGRKISKEMSEVNIAIDQIRYDKSLNAKEKQEMIRERKQYINQLASQGLQWFYSLGVEEP